jgi:hypothetical protein
VVANHHDVQGLVEDHLLAFSEGVDVELGVQGHSHLAAAGENVDRPVLIGLEVGPIGRRRLRELLDLLPQCCDVLLGLLQGERQLLVLRGGVAELTLRLEEPLLEGAHALRGFMEPPAQFGNLVLRELRPAPQLREACLFCRVA